MLSQGLKPTFLALLATPPLRAAYFVYLVLHKTAISTPPQLSIYSVPSQPHLASNPAFSFTTFA